MFANHRIWIKIVSERLTKISKLVASANLYKSLTHWVNVRYFRRFEAFEMLKMSLTFWWFQSSKNSEILNVGIFYMSTTVNLMVLIFRKTVLSHAQLPLNVIKIIKFFTFLIAAIITTERRMSNQKKPHKLRRRRRK